MNLLECDETDLENYRDEDELSDTVFDHLAGLDDEDLIRIAALVTNGYHTALVAGEPVGRIGNLYTASYMSFMSDDRKRTESAYYPQFEFNRILVMISDKEDKRGLKNFKKKEEALAFAKDFLLKQQELEKNDSRTHEQATTGEGTSI